MKYFIESEKSRADFVACAPMHKFAGWAVNTILGQLEVDLEKGEILNFVARASTTDFETGDASRNKAMNDYFLFAKYPETSFHSTEPTVLKRRGELWYGELIGILELAGVRRQLPVSCVLRVEQELPVLQLSLKWSFKAFGMKAPRLLFLVVRDIVDINAELYCCREDE